MISFLIYVVVDKFIIFLWLACRQLRQPKEFLQQYLWVGFIIIISLCSLAILYSVKYVRVFGWLKTEGADGGLDLTGFNCPLVLALWTHRQALARGL